ncbi:hypothetical protein [Actinomadura meridiana]
MRVGVQPGKTVCTLMTPKELLPGVDLGIPPGEIVRSNAVYLDEMVV